MKQSQAHPNTQEISNPDGQFEKKRERTRKNAVYIFGGERLVLLWKIAKPNLQKLAKKDDEIDADDINLTEIESAGLI